AGGYLPSFYYAHNCPLAGRSTGAPAMVIVAEKDADHARKILGFVEGAGVASAWARSGAELLRYASSEQFPVIVAGGELEDGMTTEAICSQLATEATVLAVVREDVSFQDLT